MMLIAAIVPFVLIGCRSIDVTPAATPGLLRMPPTPIPAAVDGGSIEMNIPRSISLPGQAYVHLQYTASEVQPVTITASATSDDGAGHPLDVVLEILDADGNRVAYADDSDGNIDGLVATDAVLESLTLETGVYTLRLNAFNGFQSGEVEVSVRAG